MSSPCRAVPVDAGAGDALRLVGRVVEHLDLEEIARVVDLRDGVDEPLRHVHLVEDRQLDRDARQLLEARPSASAAGTCAGSTGTPSRTGASRTPRGRAAEGRRRRRPIARWRSFVRLYGVRRGGRSPGGALENRADYSLPGCEVNLPKTCAPNGENGIAPVRLPPLTHAPCGTPGERLERTPSTPRPLIRASRRRRATSRPLRSGVGVRAGGPGRRGAGGPPPLARLPAPPREP